MYRLITDNPTYDTLLSYARTLSMTYNTTVNSMSLRYNM